jgi:DNA-binding LytR/AlgR family response regulator
MEKKKRKEEKSYFVIRRKAGIEKIKSEDILFFESEGRKINLYTKERKISFYGSIRDLRRELDERFICCHGSYEVNLTKITKFTGGAIEIEGNHILPVSQRKSAEARSLYQSYLKKHFPCNT